MIKSTSDYVNILSIGASDTDALMKAGQSYGDSWKARGGVGAFMMLARKWDRLENQVSKHHYDIFKAIEDDPRPEGIIDDIRDLRRYLLLVEDEMQRQMIYPSKSVGSSQEAPRYTHVDENK